MTPEGKDVLAAFEEMQQAMIDKNIEKMRELTVPEKMFTHMSGKRQTREEYFRDIQNGTLNYYGYRIHHPSVTVNGSYAYGTVLESWYPLGGRGHTQTLFEDEVISSIVAAHSKTGAQVILRWHLQSGNIAIPGSSDEDHILENSSIFDFELTEEEMNRLRAMEKDERFSTY